MMEVDMNNNYGLFFVTPDFMMMIKDIGSIKLRIQSRGYDNIDRENLIICTGFQGKLIHNTSIRFNFKIEKVIETLQSKGIKMIKPPEYSSQLLEGIEWDVKLKENISVPTNGSIYQNNNRLSISFSDYGEQSNKEELEDDEKDNMDKNIDEFKNQILIIREKF